MKCCQVCGRPEDRHNVRHPFSDWLSGRLSLSDDFLTRRRPAPPPPVALAEQELDPMGSE